MVDAGWFSHLTSSTPVELSLPDLVIAIAESSEKMNEEEIESEGNAY